MSVLLPALLIFCLRVTDVSIGTIRVLYAQRGRRLIATALGFVESGVFILAISRIMKDVDKPLNMLAYACGFAAGNFVGITIERWIASGTILVRIIARDHMPELMAALREHGFGATAVHGSGREGEVCIFFVVAPRRRERELLQRVQQTDPDAFVTVDTVNHALGGYVSGVRGAVSVRK
jgi:uncharacterized protein YebE (UPF0316 family)